MKICPWCEKEVNRGASWEAGRALGRAEHGAAASWSCYWWKKMEGHMGAMAGWRGWGDQTSQRCVCLRWCHALILHSHSTWNLSVPLIGRKLSFVQGFTVNGEHLQHVFYLDVNEWGRLNQLLSQTTTSSNVTSSGSTSGFRRLAD